MLLKITKSYTIIVRLCFHYNRGFSKWNPDACQPARLAKGPKCRSDSYFWIHEFRNKDDFKQIFCTVILISEMTNSEIRIISALRYFTRLAGWQAVRISFRKTSHISQKTSWLTSSRHFEIFGPMEKHAHNFSIWFYCFKIYHNFIF